MDLSYCFSERVYWKRFGGLIWVFFFWSPQSAYVPECMAACGCSTHSKVIFLLETRCTQIWGSFPDLGYGRKASPALWEVVVCRCFMCVLFGCPPSLISPPFLLSTGPIWNHPDHSLFWLCFQALPGDKIFWCKVLSHHPQSKSPLSTTVGTLIFRVFIARLPLALTLLSLCSSSLSPVPCYLGH